MTKRESHSNRGNGDALMSEPMSEREVGLRHALRRGLDGRGALGCAQAWWCVCEEAFVQAILRMAWCLCCRGWRESEMAGDKEASL